MFLIVATGLLLLMPSTAPARAQATEEREKQREVQELLKAGRAAIAAKDCAKAVSSFGLAFEHSRRLQNKTNRGTFQQEALKHIADCQMESGKLDEAEASLLDRKKILIEWGGPAALDVGHNFLDLAFTQIKRERWPQAERYAREGLAIYDQALAAQPAPQKQSANTDEDPAVKIKSSKVTGLYIVGLAQALQRRTSEALKTWEEGYILGEPLEPKPKELLQIVMQAVDLHDMANLRDGRRIWVERLRKIRSR